MTLNGWIQILIFCAIVVALVKPLGWYMTRVFNGERTFLSPVLRPVETVLYRLAGTNEREEQHWLTYTLAMLAFNLLGFVVLYALQRFQAVLPFNPMGMGAVAPDLAFNTAASFVTNTNWQNYGGESTMSYLVQMAGLTVQNFVSAATGIALAVALIRGFSRASAKSIGNFWADMTRATLYVLLPLCVMLTCSMSRAAFRRPCRPISMRRRWKAPGRRSPSVQSLRSSPSRCWARTAAASSMPIRRIRSRTRMPLVNLIQMVTIFAIGAALTNVFGRMVGDQRQGWAILGAMGVIFLVGVAVAYWAEAAGNPLVHALGVDGGNMEGKEVRFGIGFVSLLRSHHHGGELRRGQCHALELHAARRYSFRSSTWNSARSSSAASAPVSTACCSSSC